MHISYDKETDTLYIQLHAEVARGEPAPPPPPAIEVTPWMRVDLDADHVPVGIEIDRASAHVGVESVLVTDLPLAGVGPGGDGAIEAMGLVTMPEFAKRAGITESTLRDHRRGASKSPLPNAFMQVGNSPLWRPEDVDSWIAQRDRAPGRAKRATATSSVAKRAVAKRAKPAVAKTKRTAS